MDKLDERSKVRWSPHPEWDILHAPGKCSACDEFPERQNRRIRFGLNFTNEPGVVKQPHPVQGAWR